MKLTELPAANHLVSDRQRLQDMVDAAELGLIDLKIGGKIPAESVVAVTRAPLIAECRAQIAAIDRQLAMLGVEVD